MKKNVKYLVILFMLLLISTMIAITSVNAQDEPIEQIPPEQLPPQVPNPNIPPSPPPTEEVANVVVAASVGGTTDPAPGAYVYEFAATITLEATPNEGYRFLYWSVSGNYAPGHNQPPINYPENAELDPEYIPDFPSPSEVAEDSLIISTNPLQIICGYGYTYVYQPVFVPITTGQPTSDAVVTVLQAIGGNTDPQPGTYRYANGSTIVLQATPESGYDFEYWVAVGEDGHPTVIPDNPTNIVCGYGYEYSYQPMFAPAGSTDGSTGELVPAMYLYVIIVILAIVAVIGVAMALVYKSRQK